MHCFSSCPPTLLTSPTTPTPTSSTLTSKSSSARTYAFVFSTGRCGTQHLARSLRSPNSYVTHEAESSSLRARDVVAQDYLRMARSRDEATFNASMRTFVTYTKLPFLASLPATHVVYTGHLPAAFGSLPFIIAAAPPASVRVLRLRRDRVASALSLMALGPAAEDPWAGGVVNNRRWFAAPTHAHARLHVASDVWGRWNRLQRWLWVVDDVECRWQALLHGMHGRFEHDETTLERLHVLDGGKEWRRVAAFLRTDVDLAAAFRRHNSIQMKNRSKSEVSEDVLRQWDEQYREAVGPCRIAPGVHISWAPPR